MNPYHKDRSSQQKSQQTRQAERPANSMPPPAGAGDQAPAIARPRKQKLFEKFSTKFQIDEEALIDALKATAFKQQRNAAPVTNEQLIALLIVADQYGLNPFTKEIYAYPDKNGGIVPVVSIDGWIRIINEHPEFNGMEIDLPEGTLTDNSDRKYKHKPCWEWMTVTIFRKDREHNQPVTEFFDEVYRQSLNIKNDKGEWYEVSTPWQTHTKRMMRHKTIIQAGRVTFGFAGIYDDDEAQRIIGGDPDDDRVVSTVPPASSDRTQAAKDALRRQNSQPTQEQPKRQAAAPESQEEIPWEKPEGKKPPPVEKNEAFWINQIKAAGANTEQLKGVWADICAHYAGKEIPLSIEAEYKLALEGAE